MDDNNNNDWNETVDMEARSEYITQQHLFVVRYHGRVHSPRVSRQLRAERLKAMMNRIKRQKKKKKGGHAVQEPMTLANVM